MSFPMGDTPKEVVASGVKQSDAAGEAALGLLAGVLEEVARDPNMPVDARRNSVEHMQNLGLLDASGNVAPNPQPLLREAVVTPQVANSPGEAVSAIRDGLLPQAPAAQVVPEQVEAPTHAAPAIPEDVQAWLDEPDEEPEPEEELEPAAEYEDPEEDAYVDPQVATERRKRIAAEKRAEIAENLRMREAKPKWAAEVKQAGLLIPESQLSLIEAKSRRGFWKAAKAIHDTNQAVLAELGVPDPQRVVQEVTEQVQVQARQEAVAAWGTPMTTGPQGAPPPQAIAEQQRQDRLTRARQGSSFVDVIKAHMGL